MPDCHQTFGLQFTIGGGDRIQVQSEVRCELTHRKQRRAFRQFTARNQSFDLFGNLPVDRTHIRFVDGYEHDGVCCIALLYSNELGLSTERGHPVRLSAKREYSFDCEAE